MNPAVLMKIMTARKQFAENHPKFISFLNAISEEHLQEGTVIEMTVKSPNGDTMTTNIRVRESDLELLRSLKEMGK